MSTEDWQARALAAEKTVVVLQEKVIALYDGVAKTSIQRGREQARRREEQARQRRQLLEVRAAELKRYSEHLELQVAERTQALRTVLDHVTCGFLVIDERAVVGPGYTQSCHELLQAGEIEGMALPELLRVEDASLADWLRMSVAQAFEDILPEEMTLEQMPRRFQIGPRVLRIDARTVREDGRVCALLLTFMDITQLEQAEREARTNTTLIAILRQREPFRAFVSDARALLDAALDAVDSGQHVFLRRALHTIKGNAACYGLEDLVAKTHQVESQEVIGVEDVRAIGGELRSFLEKHQEVLSLELDGHLQHVYEVPVARVRALRQILEEHGDEPAVHDVHRWTSQTMLRRADQLIGPVRAFVARLAERLEKRVQVNIHGGSVMLDADRLGPAFLSLPHLLRNALDHGIESMRPPDKPTQARLDITVEDDGVSWQLVVEDDGAGIDPEHVAAHAIRKGMVTEAQVAQMGPHEKLELIFLDGLSTAETTTDVSGRGVGMSAVRASVEPFGGSVQVSSQLGRGTRIEVRVPKPPGLIL
jgi:two-component system chemotaxis sensor kinase CheA